MASEDDEVEHVPYEVSEPDLLYGALGFTPSDLESNRAGRLTDRQRRFQLRALRKSAAISVVMLVVAVACAALGWIAGIGSNTGLRLLLISVVMLAFPALGLRFAYTLLPDLREGAVSVAQGRLTPSKERTQVRRRAVWSFYLDMDDGERFQVPGKAYAALQSGRYRIYYIPRSRRVVGIEPMHEAK